MKLIINASETITLEVQPREDQQGVSYTDIIGILEYAKSVVTDQLKMEMLRIENEKNKAE